MIDLSWLPNVANKKIVLASASPRRRELLSQMASDHVHGSQGPDNEKADDDHFRESGLKSYQPLRMIVLIHTSIDLLNRM